jgi:hypothetical protein
VSALRAGITAFPGEHQKLRSCLYVNKPTTLDNYSITTMPEEIAFDPTDKGTLRPNSKPLRKKGDAFYPMKLPDFGWEINLPEHVSPDDPIILFTMYYTPEVMDLIVGKTNEYLSRSFKHVYSTG